VDYLAGRDLALDGIEKADEFDVTVALVSAAIGALPGLRVLARNKPSTPLSAKRPCHRHTVGRLTPMVCATCCAECRSAETITMRRPLHMFARPVAVGHDHRQLLALRCAQKPRILLCHGLPRPWRSIAYPAAAVGIRPAGYEDVNDANRLCRDPAMRWLVGGNAPMGRGASATQMGHSETEWLVRPENLAALADLSGQWIEAVHQRRWPRVIVLDMDSSESPTYGEQEGSAYNGHFGCTCYHPLFRVQPTRRSGTVCAACGQRA
jgi:hypothetical protein